MPGEDALGIADVVDHEFRQVEQAPVAQLAARRQVPELRCQHGGRASLHVVADHALVPRRPGTRVRRKLLHARDLQHRLEIRLAREDALQSATCHLHDLLGI